MKRVVNAIAQGMSKDADIGIVKPSLLFDAKNIRLTAREGSTLLSITNERSTKEIDQLKQLKVTSIELAIKDELKAITHEIDSRININIDITLAIDDPQITASYENSTLTINIKSEETSGILTSEDINDAITAASITLPQDITFSGQCDFHVGNNIQKNINDWVNIIDWQLMSYTIEGVVLGYCILNKYLIIFHKDTNHDYISVIYKDNNTYYSKVAYGDLNFNSDYKIEAFGLYETENLQKVYWTDGLNQPRVYNIKELLNYTGGYKLITANDVNFSPEIAELSTQPTITKNSNAGGLFPAGVVQYVFTYYNINGQQTAPFYVSPLNYITYENKAGSPEDICNCSFSITLPASLDNFDYVRIYRLVRTSINSTPIVEYLPDVKVTNTSVTIIDNGTNGTAITPTDIYYLGGDVFKCRTFTHKDGRLFCGNITIMDLFVDASWLSGIDLKYKARIVGDPGYGGNSGYTISNWNGLTLINSSENQQINVKFLDVNTLTPPLPSSPFIKYEITSNIGINIYINTNDSDSIEINASDIQNAINDSECSHWYSSFIISGTLDLGIESQHYYTEEESTQSSDWTPTTYNPPIDNFFTFELDQSQDKLMFFRYEEFYRFGVQFKDKYGHWSNVVYLGDQQCMLEDDSKPMGVVPSKSSDYPYKISQMKMILTYNGDNIKNNFIAARPVCVYPDITNMHVVAQALVCPTIQRSSYGGSIKYQSDWFARPTYQSSYITYENNIPQSNGLLSEIQIDGSQYTINRSICTLHSPEFEFNDSIRNIIESCTLRRVGKVKVLSSVGRTDIDFINPSTDKTEKLEFNQDQRIINYPGFRDSMINVDNQPIEYNGNTIEVDYVVYPWNSESLSQGISLLKQKWLSNIHRTGSIEYLNANQIARTNFYEVTDGGITYVQKPKFVDSVNPILYNMVPHGDPEYYVGNVDQLITTNTADGWPFCITRIYNGSTKWFDISEFNNYSTYPVLKKHITDLLLPVSPGSPQWTYDDPKSLQQSFNVTSNKAVSIKYKSSNHVVVRLMDNLPELDPEEYCLYNLVRTTTYHLAGKMDNNSPEALLNNIWVPCGEEVEINPESDNITLYATRGDTYYQRYEHLKTYPYDNSSMNNIVEIISFPIETRVNIQGRYDNKINVVDHLYTNPTNFNQLNEAYSQLDNFFTYNTLDSKLFNTDNFPNQVVWSLQKNSNERIDTWTNISLASIMDLDGDKGELTALKRWQDKILFFQKHGYGVINYNDRTALTVNEGLPVQLANSGTVDGKTYLSTLIGCDNKETVVEGKDGLYFADNSLKSVFLLSSIDARPTSLTDTLGMKSWMYNNRIKRSYYDKNYNDLYLFTKDDCLGYSETLKQFESFYDYTSADFLVNLENEFVSIANNKLWELFKGTDNNKPSYCKLFNVDKSYEITYRINGQDGATNNKIFDYIEYKGDIIEDNKAATDIYGTNGKRYEGQERLFDEINVQNEYQDTDDVGLNGGNTRKKFRVWRTTIPRNNNSRTRISNPWILLKLTGSQQKQLILHDMNVYYND